MTAAVATLLGLILGIVGLAVYKDRLLKGLDEVGLVLQHLPEIEAFEERHHGEHPWLA